MNVSRAIKELGGESLLLYPLGGLTGKMLQKLLDRECLNHRPFPIEGSIQESLVVLEEATGRQYRFGMPGPEFQEHEWKQFLTALSVMDPAPEYLVASGSLPPGVPHDFYARVARIGKERGAKVIIGVSGEATATERERKAVSALADLSTYFRTVAGSGDFRVEDIFSLNAVESANALNVRYILAHTQSMGAACFISRFKPDGWVLSFSGDVKTNSFLALSYGVYSVCLEDETNAGMVEKDERMILIENESHDAMSETLLMKIFKV